MKKLLLLCVIVLCGCTNARISQSFSSGLIGCPADKIKITNEKASASGIHDWIAECNGVKYACNYFYPNPATCKAMN